MRKDLERIEEKRTRFRGVFVRMGSRLAFRGPPQSTLLLKDVEEFASGNFVTDHLWFNYTKGFQALGPLVEGDMIEFDARVKSYVKGYVNYRQGIDDRQVDYKLSHPTKVVKITR